MLKKKLLVALSSLLGTSTIVGLISAGYIVNNYNDNAYQYATIPVGSSTAYLIQSYFSSAVNGSKLLYLASYIHTTPLTNALNISRANNAPINKYLGNTGFVLIDDQFGLPKFDAKTNSLFDLTVDQPIWSTNVAAAQFRTDLGSFITGITLGEFLNENQSYFLDDGKLTWSTYGALPYSSITSFMGGMQKGITWFNENIVPKKDGYKEVEQVMIGSSYNQNFAGSFDVTAGNNIVNELLARNVDVIFPVAGAQVSQVVRLIKQSNKKTVVVGVDSAVEENSSINLNLSTNTNLGYKNKIVQFSSTKNIADIVEKITTIIDNPNVLTSNSDSDEWSDLGGLGYSSLGTVKNNGVGVSDAGKPYFIKAMNIFNGVDTDIDFDTITNEELMTLYNQATSKISEQEAFKNLNLSTNKTYITSATESYSYVDIVNAGFEMLPIAGTIDEISTWYDNQYADNEALIKNKEQNLTLIQEWITNNIEDIMTRKAVKDNLVTSTDPKNDGLNKEAWEKYHGVAKIVLQDSASILFDSSFLESCYYGLKAYWYNNYGVVLPSPPTASK